MINCIYQEIFLISCFHEGRLLISAGRGRMLKSPNLRPEKRTCAWMFINAQVLHYLTDCHSLKGDTPGKRCSSIAFSSAARDSRVYS